jgi:hypothetical protein
MISAECSFPKYLANKAREIKIVKGLDAFALAKRISRAELVRRVLLEFSREVTFTQSGVGVTLERIAALIKAPAGQALSVRIASLDTQNEHERLRTIHRFLMCALSL